MYLDVENREGIRYRVREGWYHPPFLSRTFAENNVDLAMLLSFDEAVIEQIYDKFLLPGQRFYDPAGLHYPNSRQLETLLPLDPYAGAPAGLTGRRREIYRALADLQLIIEENPLGDDVLANEQSALVEQIRRGLQQIIAEERAEAARIQQEHEQRSTLGKAGAYIKRGAQGFGRAAWSLGVWLKDVAEVAAVVSPARQTFVATSAGVNYFFYDKPLIDSYGEYLADVKKEVVDVLGFDPTAITAEQLRLAFEVAELIYDDPALRSAITQFARDYVSAQHSLEITEFAGGGVFEIVLTIVLAAVTGGAGAVAALAKNARLISRFERIGELMMRFARLKKQQQRQMRRRGSQNQGRNFSDFDSVDAPATQVAPSQPAPRQKGAVESGASVPNSSGPSAQVLEARHRQALMLEDNVGFNISPTAWDDYPTIGRNGTFISDRQGVTDVIGDFSGSSQITLDKARLLQLEEAFGLERGALQEGFKVRSIDNIVDRMPRSPLEGNQYFLGPGNHLPGGAPEMVINSVPTVDANGVTTLLEVLVK